MAITFPITGVTNLPGGTRSPSFTLGTAPLEDDIIVVTVQSNTTASTTDVSGWTNVLGANTVAMPPDSVVSLVMVYHRVTAAEAAASTVTWTLTNIWDASETGRICALVLRGVATTGELDSAATLSDENLVTAWTIPSLTTTADACQLVAGVTGDSALAQTAPSGWTRTDAYDRPTASSGIFTRDSVSSSGVATGTADVTAAGSDEYVSIVAAFVPAASSSPQTVNAQVATVALTGVAPTTTGGPVSVAAQVASASLTAVAAAPTAGAVTVAAQAGAVTLTPIAGSTTGGPVSLTAQVGDVVLTSVAGSPSTGGASPQTVTAQVGAVTLTGVAPTVTGGPVTTTAQVGTITLAAVVPTRTPGAVTKTAQVGAVVLTAVAGVRTAGPVTKAAQVGLLALTAVVPVKTVGTVTIEAQVGLLTLTPVAPTGTFGPVTVAAQNGLLLISGVAGVPVSASPLSTTAQVGVLTLSAEAGAPSQRPRRRTRLDGAVGPDPGAPRESGITVLSRF